MERLAANRSRRCRWPPRGRRPGDPGGADLQALFARRRPSVRRDRVGDSATPSSPTTRRAATPSSSGTSSSRSRCRTPPTSSRRSTSAVLGTHNVSRSPARRARGRRSPAGGTGAATSRGRTLVFSEELSHLLVTQKAAFNSPVGSTSACPTRRSSAACFILAVDDTMSSILNWYVEEGTIFKGGSGSGSTWWIRAPSQEPLAGGGTASGPVSFMRGADASAGTIKSGGKTRRAAKMVILDVDHPASATSSGARRGRSRRRGPSATPGSTWTLTAATPTRSSTRTRTTRSA